MLKNYQTIEAKTHMVIKIITNPFKADFSQNQPKAQNITKPTVFQKKILQKPILQNEL
jgi:hypothetical protein